MDNDTVILEETAPARAEPVTAPETPAPAPAAKPKSKKGMMIAIAAVAVVAILLIAFILMADPGVEGKWIAEKTEIMNPDGSVNSTHVVPDGVEEWMEIKSDGTIIYGNSTETHDYNIDITWEYADDGQIEMTMHYDPAIIIPNQVTSSTGTVYWNNETLEEESQIYEYEVEEDTLTLGFLTPSNGVTLRMTYTKA